MERKKSNKPVIPLEECIKPFVFEIDGKGKVITPMTPAHFYSLKAMSKNQRFFNYREHDYDPFET